MIDERAASAPKQYHRLKLTLSLTGTFIGWAYLYILISTPLAAWLVDVSNISSNPYIHVLLFLMAVALLAQLFSFPLSFYSGFVVEHRYSLSNQTLKLWLWERAKGTLVGGVIGLPVLMFFYYALRTYGVGWWFPVGAFVFVFSVILGRLAPVLIFPLFYKFEPLDEDSPLTKTIAAMCSAQGLRVAGVFRFNMSKTTKKANAAFTGLGKSRRVLLADTLLDHFTEDEIEAIVAHELGHFKLKHIWVGMIQGTLMTFLGLYIVAQFHHFLSGGDVAGLIHLPWLGLLMGMYSFLTGPISNALSRRHEFAADRFSLNLMGSGGALINGLERLATMNLADRDPHPAVEFMFHSHPSIKRRVEAIR